MVRLIEKINIFKRFQHENLCACNLVKNCQSQLEKKEKEIDELFESLIELEKESLNDLNEIKRLQSSLEELLQQEGKTAAIAAVAGEKKLPDKKEAAAKKNAANNKCLFRNITYVGPLSCRLIQLLNNM
jgi:DNA-directed RNA polymerase beta subunit